MFLELDELELTAKDMRVILDVFGEPVKGQNLASLNTFHVSTCRVAAVAHY